MYYAIRKLLMLIPLMLGVSFLVFLMMRVLPGDPAKTRAGLHATPEMIEKIRQELQLDKPLLVQYYLFLRDAVHLDFGRSIRSNQPVLTEFLIRYPNTIMLTLTATMLFLLIGIPLGVIAAVHHGSIWDGLTILVGLIGISMPSFWLGLLLIWEFAVKLKLLPSFGLSSPAHMILPAITLAAYGIAYTARYTRSSMLEELGQDYITATRAKGLSERTVLYRHALRNSLLPILSQAALGFGYMLGGSVVIEVVFTINGIGKLIVDAILYRDFPIVQAGVLLISINFVLVNLFADLAYGLIDPRIRLT
ncbi:MAG: ABC transporter permease [Anaerolineales bacterium]|nr:ABC transporter permease [Anaerolineales bacterium]